MITKALLEQSYNDAIIHIAWVTYKIQKDEPVCRRLVFGMVEAYPKELKVFPVLKEQEKKYKSGWLYYVRVKRTISQAIAMYNSVIKKGFIPRDWNDDNLETPVSNAQDERILCGEPAELRVRSPFPSYFTLSDKQQINTPFIADIWGKANIHQVMSSNQNPYLTDFLRQEKPGEWLEQYLGWNISFYPELMGSVHFILPNPYYSALHICMIPKDEGPDQVKLDFQVRKGADASKLVIVPFEKTHFGLLSGEEIRMKKASCAICLTGKAEEFGMYIKSDEFGLIDQKDFAGFARGFAIDIYCGTEKKVIHRPDSGVIEEVDQYKKAASVYSDMEGDPLGLRLADAEIDRHRQLEATAQGLTFFYQSHDEAEKLIKSLIQNAHRSVLIADPYFASNELLAYANAVTYVDVKIEIITSADYLKTKSKLDIYKENGLSIPSLGEELFRQQNKGGKGIEITVLTGNSPAIHDRFILVDDEAWFSGGSLNAIGDRLSCIVKLADDKELRRRIDEIKRSDRAVPLKKWIEERRENANEE